MVGVFRVDLSMLVNLQEWVESFFVAELLELQIHIEKRSQKLDGHLEVQNVCHCPHINQRLRVFVYQVGQADCGPDMVNHVDSADRLRGFE